MAAVRRFDRSWSSSLLALALAVSVAPASLFAQKKWKDSQKEDWPTGSNRAAQAPANDNRRMQNEPTAAPKAPAGPKVEWTESFVQATRLARQSDKVILAYFAGSDWCEWCKKLDREVLTTPMFVDWTKQNVIPLLVDYPSPDKNQSRATAKQNEILAATYNVAKVPTLLFLDADGEVIDRVGYDSACLRENEPKGSPSQALARFASILANRPTGQQIKEYAFLEAVERTSQNGQHVLIMITRPDSKLGVETRERLLKSSKLAKFVNANMAFVNLTWPEDADVSTQANWFRTFAEAHKVGKAPIQFLVLTYGARKLQHRVLAIDQVDGLVNQLAQQLPKFDYSGGWLTDYRKAQSISAQTQRDMLIAFTSFDSSEWCQKLETEIFKQQAFTDYAKKNLVLLKADFPTKGGQSAELKTQNQSLAEGFNIRGYPSMVLINPKGQKIGTAKYMPGGPEAFIKEMEELRRKDFERRTLTSEMVDVQKKNERQQPE